MSENPTNAEYPNINTFTSASARRLSEEDLTFPEMYPHEVAASFGSDISGGLSVKQVRKLRGKYGYNIISGEVPVGFILVKLNKNWCGVFVLSSIMFYFPGQGGIPCHGGGYRGNNHNKRPAGTFAGKPS